MIDHLLLFVIALCLLANAIQIGNLIKAMKAMKAEIGQVQLMLGLLRGLRP
jgi:hypothetical protein